MSPFGRECIFRNVGLPRYDARQRRVCAVKFLLALLSICSFEAVALSKWALSQELRQRQQTIRGLRRFAQLCRPKKPRECLLFGLAGRQQQAGRNSALWFGVERRPRQAARHGTANLFKKPGAPSCSNCCKKCRLPRRQPELPDEREFLSPLRGLFFSDMLERSNDGS